MNLALTTGALFLLIPLGAGLVALVTLISIAATPWTDGDLDADFDSHTRDRFHGLRRRVYLYSRDRSRTRFQRDANAQEVARPAREKP